MQHRPMSTHSAKGSDGAIMKLSASPDPHSSAYD
jgi:hypothetical protein